MTSPPPPTQRHDPALDGIRGVAILLVMAMHLFPPGRRMPEAISYGWIGVELFFVLSGYLITTSVIERFDCWSRIPEFLRQRALRTMPAFLTAVAIIALLPLEALAEARRYILDHAGWFAVSAQNIAFAFIEREPAGIGHFWSLGVEIQFYLLWPLILVAVPRRARLAASVALLSLPIVLRIPLFGRLPFGDYSVYRFTLTHLDGIAAGAVLACALDRYRLATRLRDVFKGLAGIAGMILIVAYSQTRAGARRFQPESAEMQQLGFTCIAILFASLLGLILLRPEGARMAAPLESAPMRTIGRYSYSLYIWHLPVYFIVLPLLNPPTSGASLFLWYATMAGASAVVAGASWHLVEAPVNRWRKRRGSPPARVEHYPSTSP